ncbi:MAG: ATP-binding protein [Phycisphaerales bacterium]|nr:ATP-binding protein [Planctomycetota bacterium]
MSKEPDFATAGKRKDFIDVRLSYKIVELFSEGLYASPNKAIEELVANSFDAGAQRVAVFLPQDFHEQGATIGVLDDGEGMDAEGLKRHWLIGISNKRDLSKLPKGRQQIGKFGIGKLATYVLASRFTHISKKDGKYYSTSMNYGKIDKRVEGGVEPKTPIKIALRELTEEEAQTALKVWTDTQAFKSTGIRLFGKGAPASWTFAILSDLKEKVHEIRRGTLEWVLRTALPLRDDFGVYLDGTKLEPSKAGKGRIKRWILGKDITDLPKPAPDELETDEDTNESDDSPKRFALTHKTLGRITGYAEAYKDLLTGKSEDIGRSNGFFVYVLGRLINVTDGHFGIKPDELRHGTFGRIRVVVNMDGLDAFLQSDRERIREGPVLVDAQNILRAIFNFVRTTVESHDAEEDAGAKLARKLAGSPASILRRPIVEMARAALDGKVKSRYIALPPASTKAEREKLVAEMETRAENPTLFVGGIDFAYNATTDDGIAVYDAVTGRLRINGLHPFVGAYFDEFTSKASGLPLEVFALAEVLLESQLHQAGLKQDQIDAVMTSRDQLLRFVAQDSGRRTALTVANALRNAKNDEDRLEIEVVEAFRSLGFDSTRVGGKSKPDGVAKAHLSPDANNKPRRYNVTLEAKSKKKEGAKLKTKTFGVSTIARQRDEAQCEHAIVVAPAFDHTPGKESALAKEIKADRDSTAANNKPRTITAIHVEDLARLVQLRPVKRLGLARIREMFQTCSLPEQCKAWVDKVEKETVAKPPYAEIVNAIHQLQSDSRNEPVGYGELRNELKHATPSILYGNLEDLTELCKAMASMTGGEMSANAQTVELNQSPANVLAAIESATKAHIADKS